MHWVIEGEEPSSFDFSWTWLPWMIGNNTRLLEAVGKQMKEEFAGRPLCEEVFAEMDVRFTELVSAKYPTISGLAEYLTALTCIGDK